MPTFTHTFSCNNSATTLLCVRSLQVLLRNTEGTVQRVEDAKVTVFGCGIEASATEAKGTVLIRSAEELMNYNKSEEKLMEEVRHHFQS
jgi:NifU-like protein involved in Fe-S cluster formation